MTLFQISILILAGVGAIAFIVAYVNNILSIFLKASICYWRNCFSVHNFRLVSGNNGNVSGWSGIEPFLIALIGVPLGAAIGAIVGTIVGLVKSKLAA